MNKLENFPSINCTSLRESTDRREFIESQSNLYNIKRTNFYITDRFDDIKDNVIISGIYSDSVWKQYGTIIAHLNLLRNWYNSCNEEYAVFCEDDISFESVNYWNFTWNEFIDNLPENWECVQLSRMESPFVGDSIRLKVEQRSWHWWGAHSLMRRSYVKKILEKFCISYNEYRLEIEDLQPIIENILFYNGVVYNFPMVVEHEKFDSTYIKDRDQGIVNSQRASHNCVLNLWRTQGINLSIQDIRYG